MAKRVSARKIKIHNQYTYEQAADALGVSVQTVRLWRQAGRGGKPWRVQETGPAWEGRLPIVRLCGELASGVTLDW